ncbi:MAG: hypothetical protein BWY99_02436 [Synergistetes bacterium ADurb.BinA166]|nr:MAG: hypothetical protein BWY99_02436 [Synergistetes bacterium ADurb.BinA166]
MAELVNRRPAADVRAGELDAPGLEHGDLRRSVHQGVLDRLYPVPHRVGPVLGGDYVRGGGLKGPRHTEQAEQLLRLHGHAVGDVPVDGLVRQIRVVDVVGRRRLGHPVAPDLGADQRQPPAFGKGDYGPGLSCGLSVAGVVVDGDLACIVVVPQDGLRVEASRVGEPAELYPVGRGGLRHVVQDGADGPAHVLQQVVGTPAPDYLVEEGAGHSPVGQRGRVPVARERVGVDVRVVAPREGVDVVHVLLGREAGDYLVRHYAERQGKRRRVKLPPGPADGRDLQGVSPLLEVPGVDGRVVGVEVLRMSALYQRRGVVARDNGF